MHRLLARLALPVLLGLLGSGVAYGLDPNRTLTQYVHRIWQIQQGLPQPGIYAILQTDDGYIWLGTEAGLVRFDGVRFTTAGETGPGLLTRAWIRVLFEDRARNLWVGTNDAGLIRFQNGTATTYSLRQGLPSATVNWLLADRHGDLWVGTPAGVARLTAGKTVVYGVAQGLATDDVTAACATADGTIWVGGRSARLSTWDGARFARRSLTSVSESASVQAMLAPRNGGLWIGTTEGLIRLDGSGERLFTVRDDLADNSVLALAEGGDGSLLVGTKNGFSRLRGGEIESFRPRDGLSQSTVYSLCEDREGSLWVGTKHGLNQFFDGRTIPYTTSEGLPSNDTGPLIQDRHGDIWVGTLGAGLGRFDGHRFSVLTARDGLASNTILALAQGESGDVWVGTDAGLNRLRGDRVDQTYTVRQGLPSNVVRSLFVDHAGVLWISTSAGPTTFRNGAFVRPRGLENPPGQIIAFAEKPDGRLFVATNESGLAVYSHGRAEPITNGGSPLRGVDALYEDADGLLWAGTYGRGLWLLKDGKLVGYGVTDGLFDDEIYGIVADSQDRLWMACSKGIFWVSRSDLIRFAAGSIHRLVSTPYSPTEALRTIECKSDVQPVAWRMRDGRLWFSTIRGVIVIDPAHLERKLPPPAVIVEDVTVDGQRERPGEVRALAAGVRNLEFRYTGLSFVMPSRITFRYILEGFDRRWTDAGTRREAFYTNLPPGPFRFRVMACTVDGTCDEARSAVAFTVAPRYYQTWWFFPLCAALVGLAGWLAYQLRIRRLREQFGLVLAERSRIARELHDTLIQGFSGITMEMQALSRRLPGSNERTMLEDIIRDAGESLGQARRSLSGLRSTNGPSSGLAAAIAQSARQMTEAKGVRLRLRLEEDPPDLPAEVAYNLLRIAQEALANAVRHAEARTIEVILQKVPQGIHLSIRDDGSGFEGDESAYVQLGHYGLLGMRERASHIGAELQLATGPGRGTTVSVLLPAPGTSRVETRPESRNRRTGT